MRIIPPTTRTLTIVLEGDEIYDMETIVDGFECWADKVVNANSAKNLAKAIGSALREH
jgi:hypothetical protein